MLSLALTAGTLIVAVATFAFVLIGELRFRRRFVGVQWWLHYEKDENPPQETLPNVPRYYAYRLTNLGSESATHVSIEATSGLQSTGAKASFVKSGETLSGIRIESADFDHDWLLVDWIDASDRRFIRYQWFPLNPTGPLEKSAQKQLHEANTRTWFQRLRDRWAGTKAVGPGDGVLWTSVRNGKGGYEEYFRNHQKARKLLDQTRESRTGVKTEFIYDEDTLRVKFSSSSQDE